MSSRLTIVLVYAVCCVVWGSTWAVIRVGLGEMPPFAFAALRMTLVSLLLAPIAWRERSQLDRPLLWRLYGIGILQFGVSFGFIFAAERHVDSGLTAVLFGTYPLFAITFSRWLLPNEVLAKRHLIAIALGFVGLVLMNLDSGASVIGYAALFPVGAAVASALASVATKRSASALSPLLTLGINAQSGAAFLWLLSVALERGETYQLGSKSIIVLLYLAVFGSIIAYGCLLWLLPRISIAMVGFMTFVEGLLGVLVGMVWLGERPEPRAIAGMGVVLISVVVAVIPTDRLLRTPSRAQ